MTAKPRGASRPFRDVGELLDWATARLARARLHYGHGTDNPRDDAAALVFHALGLAHESAPASYRLPVPASGAARAIGLVERRVRERLPSAYLTGVSWFAGHAIRVTPDVLAPRSPISTSVPGRAASRSLRRMPCLWRGWMRLTYRRRHSRWHGTMSAGTA
jgi:ribosomal protein L3 glutamine methyltransferase